MDPDTNSLLMYSADILLVLFALFLVLLNGFFVGAEFAMVKLRATKVEAIAQTNGWKGRILKKVHNQLDAYLSACQLGITLSSLGLGWVGEPAFAELIRPLLNKVGVDSPELIKAVSFFTAFFIISYLHIVVGELAPKSWAIRQPEKLSLWTAVPLYLFYWAMYPAIWLLNHSANAILRIFGQEASHHDEHYYSRDELKVILHSSRAHDSTDGGMRVMASAVEMADLEAVDWANSREDLIYIEHDATLDDILKLIKRYKYSRYPIYNADDNEFIGILHIKDLLLEVADARDRTSFTLDLEELSRPLDRVSKNTPLGSLLERFKQGGVHFALVEEADGKVLGFLTMEDVLEVLVGDIQDEHRKTERGVLFYQPGKLLVRGDTPLFKIERLLHVDLDHVSAETMAGLVYDTLGRVPEEEDVIETEGLSITVKKMKGPKILLAKVTKLEANKLNKDMKAE